MCKHATTELENLFGMRVIIIGGAGFIGTNVADAFVSTGHDVVIFDSSKRGAMPSRPRLQYVESSLGNRGELSRVFAEGADAVIHLVSTTTPKSSNDDPAYDVRTNVVETVQLLDLCVRHSVKKIIFSSSGGTVYGITNAPKISEDHPTNPICSYGITKLAIEKYLFMYERLYGLPFVALRVSNPYGVGQLPHAQQGVISVFTYRILSGSAVDIWGDGTNVRDYLDVRDVAQAFLTATVSGATGIFNVGSGCGRSLLSVLSAIEEVTRKKAVVRWWPARRLDVPRIVLDVSRAGSILSWSAKKEFLEGISRVRDWITANFIGVQKS